jgi:glutaredoxin 3
MVIIYGTEWCSYCIRAKKLVEQYQLDFQFRDVDTDEMKQQLKAILPDYKTIPQIWWHGNHIGGYDDFVCELENTRSFGQDKF